MRQLAHFADIRSPSGVYVPESRFGLWFLGTGIWETHVLARAIDDLSRLIGGRVIAAPVIVDVGCGWGHSFKLLQDRFAPHRMVGIDIDPAMLEAAGERAAKLGLSVEFRLGTSASLPLVGETADLIFCHQTFHHFVDQEGALREFRRVLKPGGLLLFAESTKAYIHSWIIRLLFRHPMEVQRTAPEYLALIRASGFAVAPGAISYPYLWWSRPDLGLLEHWFGVTPRAGHEETLLNLVAVRP
jgi:ubiquinone/menaquinone biosynthesis C-methylase UbiE